MRVSSGGLSSCGRSWGPKKYHDPLQNFRRHQLIVDVRLLFTTQASWQCLGQLVACDGIGSYISDCNFVNAIELSQERAGQLRVSASVCPDAEFTAPRISMKITKFERSSPSESVGRFEGDLHRMSAMPPQPTEKVWLSTARRTVNFGSQRDCYVSGLPDNNCECCSFCGCRYTMLDCT